LWLLEEAEEELTDGRVKHAAEMGGWCVNDSVGGK